MVARNDPSVGDDSAEFPVAIRPFWIIGLLYGESFTGLCEALAALDMQFGALVIVLKRPETMHKRSYRSIRIPHAIYERVLRTLKVP